MKDQRIIHDFELIHRGELDGDAEKDISINGIAGRGGHDDLSA
jgi:hypothetical protein